MFKRIYVFIVILISSVIFLQGCGRKGALEPPPSTRAAAEENPPPPPQQDQPFILDRLIK